MIYNVQKSFFTFVDATVEQVVRAIQYRNLDEARKALQETGNQRELFDDGGAEPQGLLAVVPEDRLTEEEFYCLFGVRKGILVEVEKIPYSGYGPPAEETDYMGYVGERVAYVLKGCRLPIEITNCPDGAQDIHHLEAMILDNEHPIDRDRLAEKLRLPGGWDFDHLFGLILEGGCTAEEIDQLIHQSIQ